MSTEKLDIELDVDLMKKLKEKADAANKTPSELIGEMLREKFKAKGFLLLSDLSTTPIFWIILELHCLHWDNALISGVCPAKYGF